MEAAIEPVRASVIIPVYDAEPYLPQCLDSVLSQTMRELEVICVDDGSQDGSPQILDRYAAADPRVRVIHQRNEFGGAARNRGMAQARGEFLYFLDADDCIEPTLLWKTIDKAERTGADIVLLDGDSFDSATGERKGRHYLDKRKLPEGIDPFSRADLKAPTLFELVPPNPWTKLFRRSFVEEEGLRFQPLRNSNDLFFVLSAMASARAITYVDEQLVRYRTGHSNTTTGVGKDPSCTVQALLALRERLREKGLWEELERCWCIRAVNSFTNQLKNPSLTQAQRMASAALYLEPSVAETGYLDHEDSYYDWWKVNRAWLKAFLENAYPFYRRTQLLLGPDTVETVVSGQTVETPVVSVIIPVYDVEPYLSACLRSVCGQTLRDIEILCVDDGSHDGSLAILREAAASDARITVLHHDNRGLSVTRNIGIERARGRFVYFMDSDDLLEPDALELLAQRADVEALDLLFFDLVPFGEERTPAEVLESYQRFYHREGTYEGVLDGPQLFSRMRSGREYIASACGYLLRRSYLEAQQLRFLPSILHEDEPFTLRALLCAGRTGYMPRAFFRRRLRGSSIMTSSASFAHAYGYFRAYLQISSMLLTLPLPEEAGQLADRLCEDLLKSAHRRYAELDEAQKLTCLGLSDREQALFRRLVSDAQAQPSSAAPQAAASGSAAKASSLRLKHDQPAFLQPTSAPKRLLKKLIPVSIGKSAFETQFIVDAVGRAERESFEVLRQLDAHGIQQGDRLHALSKRVDAMDAKLDRALGLLEQLGRRMDGMDREGQRTLDLLMHGQSGILHTIGTQLADHEKDLHQVRDLLASQHELGQKQAAQQLAEARTLASSAAGASNEAVWAQIFHDVSRDSTWLKDARFAAGRWAVGYQFLYVMYRVLDEIRPASILELGLGQSTRMTAQYTAARPGTRHEVVEADPSWISFFKRSYEVPASTQITQLDYEMISFEQAETRVYRGFGERFKGQRFDLILIDAPLGGDLQGCTRVDVLRMLPDLLSDRFVIIMDDTDRAQETQTVHHMQKRLTELGIDYRIGRYRGQKECTLLCSPDIGFLISM